MHSTSEDILREDGVSVRMSSLLALPWLVTVCIADGEFSAVIRIFGITFRRLLRVRLSEIERVQVMRIGGMAEFQIVRKGRLPKLLFQPPNPQRWIEIFRRCGVTVEDGTENKKVLNKAISVFTFTVAAIGFAFACLIGLLVLVVAIASALKHS